jgi:hypothetical protein
MEKANFEFWNTIAEISLPQAAYLWCGYEMPPDEIIVVERPGFRVGERVKATEMKGKALPQNVRLVLFQLINAGISGSLLLKDGQKLQSWDIKKYMLKSPERIGPGEVNFLSGFLTTREHLRNYAISIGERPEFLFPDTHKKTVSNENPIDSIIGSVIFGVDKIYEAVKAEGFSGQDPTPFDKKKSSYREAAFKRLSEIEIEYPSIKKEFLSPEMFDFQDTQQRRDFIGKLLRKILIDQGVKKPGEYTKIYKRSNDLKKKLSGDMSENPEKD